MQHLIAAGQHHQWVFKKRLSLSVSFMTLQKTAWENDSTILLLSTKAIENSTIYIISLEDTDNLKEYVHKDQESKAVIDLWALKQQCIENRHSSVVERFSNATRHSHSLHP